MALESVLGVKKQRASRWQCFPTCEVCAPDSGEVPLRVEKLQQHVSLRRERWKCTIHVLFCTQLQRAGKESTPRVLFFWGWGRSCQLMGPPVRCGAFAASRGQFGKPCGRLEVLRLSQSHVSLNYSPDKRYFPDILRAMKKVMREHKSVLLIFLQCSV